MYNTNNKINNRENNKTNDNQTPSYYSEMRSAINFELLMYNLFAIIFIIVLIGILVQNVLGCKQEEEVDNETVIIEPTVTPLVIEEPTIRDTNIEDTTEVIIIEPTVEATSEQIIEQLPIVRSYNTSIKSNLTEEEIEYILQGTYLEGTGWAFKKIEDTYNVNVVFALSVAETETTFGKFGVAQSYNNAFGLTSINGGYLYFDSIEDSILYFGEYIPRVMWNNHGVYYIGDIAPLYCDEEWGYKVEGSLDYWYDIAENIRE